ncbi:unannotated protein [freshwater metagenome]|uniref:Unannotated protein n=1 Tax=freshwater metagenome TaxID=449393 RepID=A0A6J6B0I2_9ZZZZ
MVTGVDHLGLNFDQRTVVIGPYGHFVNVKTKLIQALDAAINLPLFFDFESFGAG